MVRTDEIGTRYTNNSHNSTFQTYVHPGVESAG